MSYNRYIPTVVATCNGTEYSHILSICCQGQLHNKVGVAYCCGHSVFYPLRGQRCKDGRPILSIFELDSPEDKSNNLDPR